MPGPDQRALDGELDERLQGDAVSALEGDPKPGTAQVRVVTLPGQTQPVALELGRAGLVAQREMGETAEEQVPRIPHTRRREVCLDGRKCALGLGCETGPVAEGLRQLELERDGVDTMVRRQPLREAGVEVGQTSCLIEPTDRSGAGDPDS